MHKGCLEAVRLPQLSWGEGHEKQQNLCSVMETCDRDTVEGQYEAQVQPLVGGAAREGFLEELTLRLCLKLQINHSKKGKKGTSGTENRIDKVIRGQFEKTGAQVRMEEWR